MDNSVNLSISKDIVNPIVETKIKDAIVEALGGSEDLINKVVNSVFTQKVNAQGKVDSYSSSNKFTWLDVVVTQKIQEAVKEALEVEIQKSSNNIKDALISQLQTKKGSSAVASAMIAGLTNTFKNSWSSKMELTFNQKSSDY